MINRKLLCGLVLTMAFDLLGVVDTSTTVGTNGDLYCVIDLSEGYAATNYPVSFLSEVPKGGWTDEYKTTKLVLRRIPAGEFMLQNITNTILTKSYYIGVFEVTQKQWELVIGDWKMDFAHFVRYGGDNRPADACSYQTIRGTKDGLSWPYSDEVDANSFLYRIRQKTGLRFDLPTEAQWEYAARANATNGIYFIQQSDENDVIGKAVYKWCHVYPYAEHGVVGSLAPNNWGLYDMCGNVWEWCLDSVRYTGITGNTDIRNALVFGGENPKGTETDEFNRRVRMMRGGGWNSSWFSCYSGSRRAQSCNWSQDENYFEWDCGFRLVVGSDHRIMVSATVTGNGSVTGCGEYDYGDVATLTATPDAGYQFVGWSGASEETNAVITVRINGAKTYTATFKPIAPTLSVGASYGRIALTWKTVAWADSYYLYRSKTGDRPAIPFAMFNGTTDHFDDYSADAGDWYYYWIEAKNATDSEMSHYVIGHCSRLSIVLLSITGGTDSMFVGEQKQYECWAWRNDSTKQKVEPMWSISEGNAYAEVSDNGEVVGLDVGGESRTVVLTARYDDNGTERMATRTLRILAVSSKFGFENLEGGLMITSIPKEAVVDIPEAIDGVPVVSIGQRCSRYNTILTTLVIPSGVTNIADEALIGATNLKSVEFGAGLVSVGNSAFSGCTSLKEVTFPNSLISVGDEAFYECSSLKKVTLPDSVTFIGSYAFYKTGIEDFRIPKHMTSLSSLVLAYCSSLTNISWGSRLEKIGSGAFTQCHNLVDVKVPNTVTNVGAYAFAGCSGLEKLTFPIEFRKLEYNLINGCTSLATLIFEGDVPDNYYNYFFNKYYGEVPTQVSCYAYCGNESWASHIKYGRARPLSEERYPVYFEMNNGVADSETIKVDAGSKINSFPNPQNRDLTLIGWYTKRVAGVRWTDEMTVECPTKLFARWGYPIVYSGLCGSSSVNPTHYNTGDVVTFSAPDKREGYTFAGWSPSCLTGTETGAVLVAANWQPNQYTIRFHANGGAWSMSDQVCEYGQTYSLIKNAFAKEYYNFAGWATTETGDVVYGDMQSIANLSTKNGAIIDLYAVWALKYVPSPILEAPENLSFTGKTTKVTLDIGLTGAAVYYSTNGVPPQVDKACLYNGPFAIDRTTTIMVIAVLGGTQSSCASFVVSKQITSLDDLGDSPSAEDVAEAVAYASDPQIVTKIDETNYNDFRAWACRVKTKGGSDAGLQSVMSVDNAWLSYALGQDTLLQSAPTDKDLLVETFAPAVEAGKFDFTVSIDKVPVGDDAKPSNLAKVLGVEGGTTLESGGLSSENVNISFGTPEGGKVKLTAGPKDTNAKAFFMKVKLNP